MPSTDPTVEIEIRRWSPTVDRRQASRPRQPALHSLDGDDDYDDDYDDGLEAQLRRSSSPIFVAANKIGSTSHSANNSLPKQGAAKLALNGHTPLLPPPPPGPRAWKRTQVQDVVWPPADEPRLKSIFDGDQDESCVWSPSQRVARYADTFTCQWVVNDEGFGDIERCEKVFVTAESLAKHVRFAHCEPPRSSIANGTDPLLPCAWGSCKFKRYTPARLKDHVLEHLRPLAYLCPFEACRMSANSHLGSSYDLDGHIQTYHMNGEALRPLGIPRPVRSICPDAPPLLPKEVPRWMVNNRPIGIRPDYRRGIAIMETPEPNEPGKVQPWDQIWLELNKREPPAIPIPASLLTTPAARMGPPTIRISTVPEAKGLSRSPSHAGRLEVDLPLPDRVTAFIDLTDDDIDIFPPPLVPAYQPSGNMSKALEKLRQAKAKYLEQLRLISLDAPSPSSSGGEEDSDSDSEAPRKRVKREPDP